MASFKPNTALKTHLRRQITVPIWAFYYGVAILLFFIWLDSHVAGWIAGTVFAVFLIAQALVFGAISIRDQNRRLLQQSRADAAADIQAQMVSQ